jgi:hypothetical protein
MDFAVFSTDNTKAGTYSLALHVTLSDVSGVGATLTDSTLFSLVVIESIPTIVVNVPPMFTEDPVASFDVNVGDSWSYTLPSVVDPEGTDVTVTAELG